MVVQSPSIVFMTNVDVELRHRAKRHDLPSLEQKLRKSRIFLTTERGVFRAGVLSDHQCAGQSSVRREAPVHPKNGIAFEEYVERVFQKHGIGVLLFQQSELLLDPPGMRKVVVVPLAKYLASCVLDGEIAKRAEFVAARNGDQSNMGAAIAFHQTAHLSAPRGQNRVQDDHQFLVVVGLLTKTLDTPLDQGKPL